MVNVYPEPLNSVASAPSGGGFIGGGLSIRLGVGLNCINNFLLDGAPRLPGDYAPADYAVEDYRLSGA